jgi:hypothetical protein
MTVLCPARLAILASLVLIGLAPAGCGSLGGWAGPGAPQPGSSDAPRWEDWLRYGAERRDFCAVPWDPHRDCD